MWISKSKWRTLEKRIADLEKEVQSQPLEIVSALMGMRREELFKSGGTRHRRRSENQSDGQA